MNREMTDFARAGKCGCFAVPEPIVQLPVDGAPNKPSWPSSAARPRLPIPPPASNKNCRLDLPDIKKLIQVQHDVGKIIERVLIQKRQRDASLFRLGQP